MSNLQAVIKVADQLMTRLFDHRQFTSGEISHHTSQLRNLEENFDRCLKINQNICILSDNDLSGIEDQTPSQISQQLSLSCSSAQNILEMEKKYQLRVEGKRTEAEKVRSEAEMELALKMAEKLEATRESLELQEQQLKQKYIDFENNLRRTK